MNKKELATMNLSNISENMFHTKMFQKATLILPSTIYCQWLIRLHY